MKIDKIKLIQYTFTEIGFKKCVKHELKAD